MILRARVTADSNVAERVDVAFADLEEQVERVARRLNDRLSHVEAEVASVVVETGDVGGARACKRDSFLFAIGCITSPLSTPRAPRNTWVAVERVALKLDVAHVVLSALFYGPPLTTTPPPSDSSRTKNVSRTTRASK